MSGILNSLYNNSSFALRMHANAMADIQEQIYTGSRINRPSDDPSVAYRIMGLESEQKSLQNYMSNILNISGTLEQSSTVLNSMATKITETKVNLTQVISGSYGQGSTGTAARARLANEIDDTLEQMVTLANSSYLGQYVFGGSTSSTAPYEVQRTNGQISSVTYKGSLENRNIEVSSGIESSGYFVGQELFSSDSPQEPVFIGSGGAAAGSGTSSIKGNAWLEIEADGSGSFDLSIDGGVTKVNIAAAVAAGTDITNIAVKNASGDVLYVDATDINSTGTELVQVAGSNNLFNTLITVRDLLNNEMGLPDADVINLINKFSEPLEEIRSLLVEKQVAMGTKIGFLDDLKNNLEDVKANAEDEATVIQQADIAQLSIDLSRREVLYQMSLSVTGKLMTTSLLDYI